MKQSNVEQSLSAIRRAALGTRADFLKIELDVSITFAKLALNSSDELHRLRLTNHARIGYETFRRFVPLASLTSQQNEGIAEKIAWLKAALTYLGKNLEIEQ